MEIGTGAYRNLALHRPAFHSSSYDYNLTAQLITDGIKDTRLPTWVAVSLEGVGPLSKPDREIFLDHFPITTIELKGTRPSVFLELGGGESAPAIDRVATYAWLPAHVDAGSLKITIAVSDDGRTWIEAGSADGLQPIDATNYPPDLKRNAVLYHPSIPLQRVSNSRFYRVTYESSAILSGALQVQWHAGEVAFFHQDQRVQIGGPYDFTSAWMSAGLDEEWVYVDLGGVCTIDRVQLYWIARAAEGSIQVS